MKECVLVTGGAGYIGTHTTVELVEAGYDVVTPVIVCNTPQFPDMVCKTGMDVKAGDVIIELD